VSAEQDEGADPFAAFERILSFSTASEAEGGLPPGGYGLSELDADIASLTQACEADPGSYRGLVETAAECLQVATYIDEAGPPPVRPDELRVRGAKLDKLLGP
jgi:hypothetical protein